MSFGDEALSADSTLVYVVTFDRTKGGLRPNVFLQSVLDAWATKKDGAARKQMDFTLLAEQIDMDEFYAYIGSNTVPPC